jgi:hypothetical protein
VTFARDNYLLKCEQGQDHTGESSRRDILLHQSSPLVNTSDVAGVDLLLMGTGTPYAMETWH